MSPFQYCFSLFNELAIVKEAPLGTPDSVPRWRVLVVLLHYVVHGQVDILLGGSDILVTHYPLQGCQVTAIGEEICG